MKSLKISAAFITFSALFFVVNISSKLLFFGKSDTIDLNRKFYVLQKPSEEKKIWAIIIHGLYCDEIDNQFMTLSFPGKTSAHSKELNSKLFYSSGTLASDIDYFKNRPLNFKSDFENFITSNILLYPGSSGASLININTKKIYGVLSAGSAYQTNPDHKNGGRFISANRIDELSNSLSASFSCD